MNVNGIANAHFGGPRIPAAGQSNAALEPVESELQPSVSDTVELGTSAEGSTEPGVIRLLQEGHFKGVADVRLRIVHHERLAAADGEATQVAAGTAFRALGEAVAAQLDEAAEVAGEAGFTEDQMALLAEARETFETALAASAEALEGAAGPIGGGLTQQLQAAFDALMGSLSSLEGVQADESAEAPEALEAAAPSSWQLALSALEATFAEALEGLTGALTSTTLLPELSPPSGNGGAYEKFLAQYLQLQSPQPLTDALPADGVDVEA